MAQVDTGEQERKEAEVIFSWFHNVKAVLQHEFPNSEADGRIGKHPVFGPMFAYTLQHGGKEYSCGFFLNELAAAFQNKPAPNQWLASFFVELLRSPEGKPLPKEPQTEDEVKAMFDKVIVPHCAQTVRDEFPDQAVYCDLDLHPEHGPVFEAGFPVVKEGNNVVAFPLQFLLALYLLNRDPADPVIQGMYNLYEEHKLGEKG